MFLVLGHVIWINQDIEAILDLILLDNLLNRFSFTGDVEIVGTLYFCVNIVSTKQCVKLELIKIQKVGFWM